MKFEHEIIDKGKNSVYFTCGSNGKWKLSELLVINGLVEGA